MCYEPSIEGVKQGCHVSDYVTEDWCRLVS